jgi:hypothetical protein
MGAYPGYYGIYYLIIADAHDRMIMHILYCTIVLFVGLIFTLSFSSRKATKIGLFKNFPLHGACLLNVIIVIIYL